MMWSAVCNVNLKNNLRMILWFLYAHKISIFSLHMFLSFYCFLVFILLFISFSNFFFMNASSGIKCNTYLVESYSTKSGSGETVSFSSNRKRCDIVNEFYFIFFFFYGCWMNRKREKTTSKLVNASPKGPF